MTLPATVKDIQHCLYINLECRTDRNEQVQTELIKLGIMTAQRFNAVLLPKKSGSGAVGCSMSHLKCLQTAKANNWPYVLIVEDDIEFTDPEVFSDSFEKFMTKYGAADTATQKPRFDVCLFAGNNAPPFRIVAPFVTKIMRCQTTTGYFVCAHYYDTLIANFREGIGHLMRDPEIKRGQGHWTEYQIKYAIDKWWFQLQERDQWFIITPLTVTQREDFSDIEGHLTNYSSALLDLTKANLLRKYATTIRGTAPSHP